MSGHQFFPSSVRGAQNSLVEFVELNRQRVFGTPALTITQMERWQELRDVLGDRFADSADDRDTEREERREHIRNATHIRVRVDSREQCTAMDVSRGGIFIATRRPLPVGCEISLLLEVPNSKQSIQLSGSVVRIETAGELAPRSGMGIMFGSLDRAQCDALDHLMGELFA